MSAERKIIYLLAAILAILFVILLLLTQAPARSLEEAQRAAAKAAGAVQRVTGLLTSRPQ
jgi:hypothetical protein